MERHLLQENDDIADLFEVSTSHVVRILFCFFNMVSHLITQIVDPVLFNVLLKLL